MPYVSPDFELHVQRDGIHLPWATIEALVKEVRSQTFTGCFQPKAILALGKGAMIPARLLAKDSISVYYVGVRSYKGHYREGISCYQDAVSVRRGETMSDDSIQELPLNDPGTMVVDDLWDTGETFQWAKKRWPKAKTAALLSKKSREETDLDFVGLCLPTESWIIFPWER